VWDIEALGNKWVAIPGGTFQMGCSPGDGACNDSEKPVHSVTLSSFEMLETEVTEGQYQAGLGSKPSCHYNGASDSGMPVECVSWFDASEFCELIGGRLPTEAEWEYAARGGKTTRYYCGSNESCLGSIAWYSLNSGDKKHPVKEKSPNDYGLYDMLGNVKEWVNDWSGAYGADAQTDPQGPGNGSNRVGRGGSFADPSYVFFLRVSTRDHFDPSGTYYPFGFRCSRFK
jgi:formylglycine-generating enzyme required for sulfatase activity